MRTKKNIVIAVMLCAVIFLSVGFAIFQTDLVITGVGNATGIWKIEITNVESIITGDGVNLSTPTYSGPNASFYAGLKKPGDKIEYKITVSNTGTVDAIIDDVVINASGSGAIIYSVEGLQSDVKLAKQTSTTFSVITEFDKAVTSIPADASKQINIAIITVQDVDQELNPGTPSFDQTLWLSNKILADNFAQSDVNIDFSSISSDTNGKGLYYTSSNTENNLPTYYFRGNVENNYVKFGKEGTEDIYWRIVRINEDGSVRLIYAGNSKDATGADATIGNSKFNELGNDNAYVGYMYGLPESTTLYGDVDGSGTVDNDDAYLVLEYSNGMQIVPSQKAFLMSDINRDGTLTSMDASILNKIVNGSLTYDLNNYSNLQRYNNTHNNAQDSTIKAYLDNWYTNNLSSYSSYLADAGFCNDRSIASSSGMWNAADTALGYSNNKTFYGASVRHQSPQFKCPNANNDLFTLKDSSKGNAALDNPIGLITVDELLYAGAGFNGITNSNFYLYIGDIYYYSMTPSYFHSSYLLISGLSSNGSLGASVSSNSSAVRPVINLRGDLIVTDGDGTAGDPYIIGTGANASDAKYTVKVSSNNASYGTVSPATQTVNVGGSVTVTITPATGYVYSSNTCNGIISGNTMTIANVTTNKNCKVYFENEVLRLANKILQDNTAQSDANIDFSQISSDTNGKGLYYTSTNTENNRITYYFRGDVDNNYVKLGNLKHNVCKYNGATVNGYYVQEDDDVYTEPTEDQCLSGYVCGFDDGTYYYTGFSESSCSDWGGTLYTNEQVEYVEEDLLWRIVRINEDGSIRIVTQESVGVSAFNTNYDDNAYVGYMYGTIGATGDNAYKLTHTNTTDSTIKDYLDNWYNSNLSSYSSYLADAGFCNDRSVAPSAGLWHSSDTALGYAQNQTHYGAYNRLRVNKTPQFACPNPTNDLFTTSTSSKGNKALSNPIGLLTADEVAYAGGVYNKINASMYLTNDSCYWTMSPFYFNGSFAYELHVGHEGYELNFGIVVNDDDGGVRPVANLQSSVEIELTGTGDPGTITNPYIVKTN